MQADWEKAVNWWDRIDLWYKSVEETHPYSHGVTFDGGETRTEQEQWLDDSLRQVGLSKRDICYRWENSSELCLAFKTFYDFAKFKLRALGDDKRGYGGCRTDCVIDFTNGVDPQWIRAARAFCDAANIEPQVINTKPEIEISDRQAVFKFEYFSALAGFRLAVESGEIDALANSLRRQEVLWGITTENKPKAKPQLTPYRPRPC